MNRYKLGLKYHLAVSMISILFIQLRIFKPEGAHAHEGYPISLVRCAQSGSSSSGDHDIVYLGNQRKNQYIMVTSCRGKTTRYRGRGHCGFRDKSMVTRGQCGFPWLVNPWWPESEASLRGFSSCIKEHRDACNKGYTEKSAIAEHQQLTKRNGKTF